LFRIKKGGGLMKGIFWPIMKIRSSLRARIVTIIISLSIIPLSILGIISYTNYLNTISTLTTQSVIQIAEQLNKNIEGMMDDTEKLLELADNEDVVPFLKVSHATYSQAKNILELFRIYRNAYKFNPSIKGIYIIGINGKCISENEGVYNLKAEKLGKSKTFNEIVNSIDNVSIISGHIPDYTFNNSNDTVISIGKVVREKVTHEVIGVIIIDLDISIIKDLCNNVKIGNTGYFFILNKNREPVFNPGHDYNKHARDYNWDKILKADRGSTIAKINGENNLIVNNIFARTEWEIIGQVPLNEIMKSAYSLRNITIFIIGLCVIFIFIILIFISDSLTRPIKNLRKTMRLAEMGDLEVRAISNSNDEIAELCTGFNKMIIEIKQLLDDSIEEHENLKKSELKVLQSQINPHFLYNTLDAILWLAEDKENAKVIELVSALSKFFRISLSKGRDFIKINDEIEHSRSYLIIQKIRYEDVLDYEIDINDNILDYVILKLILQPIVENAIYHGIKNKRGGGKITLKGYSQDTSIVFEVVDNGIGIKEDILAQIQEDLDSDNNLPEIKKRGFGLYNVDRRIKLYYGKEYGLCVDSQYSQGTVVKICIPMRGDISV
jgi:two-component system, sensor histidine kinase YesM